MKRLSWAVFASVLIVFGIQPLFAQVQGQWATTGTMQSARELNTQALLSNGKVLSMHPVQVSWFVPPATPTRTGSGRNRTV